MTWEHVCAGAVGALIMYGLDWLEFWIRSRLVLRKRRREYEKTWSAELHRVTGRG